MRTLERLLEDQERLLSRWRRSREVPTWPTRGPGWGSSVTAVRYGKVASVVTSDPTFGPHVTVIGQVSSGSPGQWEDSTRPAFRAYAAPGLVITGFAVDQFVRVHFMDGIIAVEGL